MPQIRTYTLVVGQEAVEITEAGPSRCADTVLIVGACDDVAHGLLVQLGRFTRVISIPEWSPNIVDVLNLSNIHIVLNLDTDAVNEVVDLLQRTIAID
ncbi:MAG: hypothetical protein BMS9Abin20_1362 [Acidimicrobiia bacterium]|nr:MAG: hypothetical protein BMS9Abin20_1362 [Acidimicrobiia bacterium]